MKFAVLQFPGSNCDQDCVHVLQNVLGHPTVYCGIRKVCWAMWMRYWCRAASVTAITYARGPLRALVR